MFMLSVIELQELVCWRVMIMLTIIQMLNRQLNLNMKCRGVIPSSVFFISC